nr:hypothetical protein [Neorhizobium tomejilense]
MLLKLDYLTQYHGSTNRTNHKKFRWTWANLEVEVDHADPSAFKRVMQSNVGRNPGDFVYHDGTDFWADVDETNVFCGDLPGGIAVDRYHRRNKAAKTSNFHQGSQRSFSWNTFGTGLFDRMPAGHFYSLNTSLIKDYHPGTDVEWDDTAVIAERYQNYIRNNLAVLDGTVLCRIERPCFVKDPVKRGTRFVPVFTPHGGYGDPVLDFQKLFQLSLDPDFIRFSGWRWLIPAEELAEIDHRSSDPLARGARAAFVNLFRQRSWISEQYRITRGKSATKLAKLFGILKARGASLDEDHLDEITDVLLTLAEEGPVRSVLEAWQDRPIMV